MLQYNYLLSIQYDGTQYSGWAKQSGNIKTIFSLLEMAIKLIIKNEEFKLLGVSRTDSGTHAKDQKSLLSLNFAIHNLETFQLTLNKILPNDIYVNSIICKDNQFKLKSYKFKIYKYYINFSNEYDVLNQRHELKINNQDFDYKKMKKILKIFIGYHNFNNFCGLKVTETVNRWRKIDKILFKCKNKHIIITFIAHSFIRYQIRYIIGTSIAYAKGKISLAVVKAMLYEGNKIVINKYKAKSKGLVLSKIQY